MKFAFQEERATQVAARFAYKVGGRINHMRLIKLMYLVEREALSRFGRLVTFDWLISMTHGPVLSATLNRINEVPASDEASKPHWQRFFSPRSNHEVSLLVSDPPIDALSRAEVELVDEIFAKFGKYDQWELRDWCHANCPEWSDPGSSRTEIDLRVILTDAGFSEEDAEEVLDSLRAESLARELSV